MSSVRLGGGIGGGGGLQRLGILLQRRQRVGDILERGQHGAAILRRRLRRKAARAACS